MPKKLTYEFIESEFKKANYKLISKTYIGANDHLEYKCAQNHLGKMSWGNFSQGYRCRICYGNAKPSIDLVRNKFNEIGYKLLSSDYKNAHTFLEFECAKQHRHRITYHKFQQGQRCGLCSGRSKLSLDFIKNEFEAAGYKLLSSDYVNANAFLEYECSQQHRHRISWAHFNAGHRCGKCYALTRNYLCQNNAGGFSDSYANYDAPINEINYGQSDELHALEQHHSRYFYGD